MAYGLARLLCLRRFQTAYAGLGICLIAASTIVPAYQHSGEVAQVESLPASECSSLPAPIPSPEERGQVASPMAPPAPAKPTIPERDINEARRMLISKGVVNEWVIVEVTQPVNKQWKTESEVLRNGETIPVQLRHTDVTFTVQIDARNNVSFAPVL